MLVAHNILILFLLFQLKHFVFDWLYQPPWQYKNKGTYGHWGGLAHSLQHAIPTFFILFLFCQTTSKTAFGLACIEFSIHYHMDWFKMNVNRWMGWGPTTSENFWRWTGFDQLIHQLNYLFIIYMVLP